MSKFDESLKELKVLASERDELLTRVAQKFSDDVREVTKFLKKNKIYEGFVQPRFVEDQVDGLIYSNGKLNYYVETRNKKTFIPVLALSRNQRADLFPMLNDFRSQIKEQFSENF